MQAGSLPTGGNLSSVVMFGDLSPLLLFVLLFGVEKVSNYLLSEKQLIKMVLWKLSLIDHICSIENDLYSILLQIFKNVISDMSISKLDVLKIKL